MQGSYVNIILQHFLKMQFAYCTHRSKSPLVATVETKKSRRDDFAMKSKVFCSTAEFEIGQQR